MDPSAIMSMMGSSGGGSSPFGKGLEFALSWATTGGQNQLIKVQNAHNQAIAEINNSLRKEQNSTAAAWAATRNWQQAYNNNQVLKNAGVNVTATSINTARHQDATSIANLNKRTADMEQRGAAAAAQAASGVSGSVGDMISGTIALRQAMTDEQVRRTGSMAAIDAAQRSGDIMRQAVSNLGNEYITAQLDYGFDIAKKQETMSPFARFYQAAGGAQGVLDVGSVVARGASKAWDLGSKYVESLNKSGFRTNQDAGVTNMENMA